jgi:hypothetical protein
MHEDEPGRSAPEPPDEPEEGSDDAVMADVPERSAPEPPDEPDEESDDAVMADVD